MSNMPIAVYPLLADYGIEIFDIEYDVDDCIVWGWPNSSRRKTSKVETDENGRSLFFADKIIVYLDECIKTGIGRSNGNK